MKKAGVNKIQRIMRMVICAIALCVLGLRPAYTFADADGTIRLIADYAYQDNEFHIFRVAENTADGFVPAEAYRDYRISLEAETASEWRALAATLAAYTQRDRIAPLASRMTDSSGAVEFCGLEPGMYLVMGETRMKNGYRYRPVPFLVVLGEEDFLSAQVKYEEDYVGGGDISGKMALSVRKVWKDSGSESLRPDSVIIQLLSDGEVCDTVVLNEENQWSFVWNDLDRDGNWNVAEDKVPMGYTVSIEQESSDFTVTNTCMSAAAGPGAASVPSASAFGTQSPETGDEGSIILWIAVLVVSGAAVRTLGCFVKRKR